jgi:hypothetical protein
MLSASHFIEIMHVNATYAGNFSHIERLGQHAIVLNSIKTTMDMLDKKSFLYSDRPVFSMAGRTFASPLWHRKKFHRIIGSRTAMKVYYPVEETETYMFFKRVLAKPEDLPKRIR